MNGCGSTSKNLMLGLEHYSKLKLLYQSKRGTRRSTQPSHVAILQVSVLPSADCLRLGTQDCQVDKTDWIGINSASIFELSQSMHLTPAGWGLGHNNSTSLNPAQMSYKPNQYHVHTGSTPSEPCSAGRRAHRRPHGNSRTWYINAAKTSI